MYCDKCDETHSNEDATNIPLTLASQLLVMLRRSGANIFIERNPQQ